MILAAKRLKDRTAGTAQPSFAGLVLILVLFLFLPAGHVFAAAPPSHIDVAEIRRRPTNWFQEADFFKPVEQDSEALTFKLAPLLLEEVKGHAGENREGAPFGTLLFTNGTAVVDCSAPALYVLPGTVDIGGKPHLTFTYLWFYTAAPVSRRGGAGLPAQGVRLTLNSAGAPATWEILADPSGAELVFVSESLERTALARYGKPLPGRRYAVERGTNETPGIVVARVIDDGPVPMGPIVYLAAGSHAVSTLICRCMPAQAKTLRLTRTYDLQPLRVAAPELARLGEDLKRRGHAGFWPGEESSENRLQTALRLPADF